MFVDQEQNSTHKSSILCPLCGLKFIPDGSNICPSCTLASLDSQTLLSPSEDQLICSYCNRYERPPWVHCEREGADLLAILLKKVRGLSKYEIKNAKFVWTEPHSKRIRIKIDFVRVINQTTKVQQTEVVSFIERYTQCNDCKKQFTPHDWSSLIQIRQHSAHKRTLLALEQNLSRQKWVEKALKVETVEGGLDLFFRNEQDAVGCVAYIKSHVPVSEKTSRETVSTNEKSNTSNTKITHALIIPQINKDDLLLMHPKFCKQLGNCSPLLLCLKVTSQLYFLDPTCNRKLVITPSQFFGLEPYGDIFSFKHYGRVYTVLDNEGVRNQETHNTVATYGVIVTPEEEMKQLFTRTHLNCEIGSDYQGYTLEEWQYIKNMPNFILVKRIKTEEELAKKKMKKDEKRKKKREEVRKKKEKEKQQKKEFEEKEQKEEKGEAEKGEEGEEEYPHEIWEDVSDEDDL